jgi:hypothetical protein
MTWRRYANELGSTLDGAWRRFWFAPRDAGAVGALRIIAGLFAVYFFLSHSLALLDWFGPHALLPRSTVARLSSNFGESPVYRFSILQLSDQPAFLWTVHGLCLLTSLLFTAGCFARVTGGLTFVAVLSYIHRGPMIAGPFEYVLSFLLAYLWWAPSGAAFGWDARRREPPAPSRLANVSWRLIQVHLSAVCVLTGLTMLAGETWWLGDTVWWLIAHSESRLIDVTFLVQSTAGQYLLNLLTHAMPAFFLLYGLLVWHRLARPLLVPASLVVWTFLGLVTGQLSYCLLMMALNAVYLNSRPGRRFGSLFDERPAAMADESPQAA